MEKKTALSATSPEIAVLVKEAFKVAKEAGQAYIDQYPDQWYPCGFAWVIIKPNRGPLASYLKLHKLADKGYYGGLQVYNPSGLSTQWMYAKSAGARAFAKFLSDRGFNAYAEERID